MVDLAERFLERFAGLDRAHGRTETGEADDRGKVAARSFSVKDAGPSKQLWQQHLDGMLGLGVFPLRDDGKVVWGTIDIDDYKVDPIKVEAQCRALDLPLIICRSKSGGVHAFLFMSEPTSAKLVRDKLMEWAAVLGYGGVEVFPKQTRLAGPKDFGNWLNMPYQAFNSEDGTKRYAIRAGKQLTAEEFLTYATLRAVDGKSLKDKIVDEDPNLTDGPPCLQTLARHGFPPGTRNQGLFNLGVYARKRFGEDELEKHLDELNQLFMAPPLGAKEVSAVGRSLRKKTYSYRCQDDPIASVCNRQICIERRYGVRTDPGDPGIAVGAIERLKTKPVTWIIDVNGFRIETTTAALRSQKAFNEVVMEETGIWPLEVPIRDWNAAMKSRVDAAIEIAAPEDATSDGSLMGHLEDFCSRQTISDEPEAMLKGSPYANEGLVYFRAKDFAQFLESNRVKGWDGRKLWNTLKLKGALHHSMTVKGKIVKCWSVPSFSKQKEPFTVPTVEVKDQEM